MNKLQKALAVRRDLNTLDFICDNVYTLNHPEGLYSLWVANGFWFTSLYKINGKSVRSNPTVSKFGAIGKIIVWWSARKQIKNKSKEENTSLLAKAFPE